MMLGHRLSASSHHAHVAPTHVNKPPTGTRVRQIVLAAIDRRANAPPAPKPHPARPAQPTDKSPARPATSSSKAPARQLSWTGASGNAAAAPASAKRVDRRKGRKPVDAPVEDQRLAKVLAAAGVASRRACEELIAAGEVSVNGTVVTQQGTKINPRSATVSVRGEKVAIAQAPRLYYFAVNKPKGYICSNVDSRGGGGPEEAGRRAVDLLQPWLETWTSRAGKTAELPPRFFTVGRLDVASYGLLFVTNDGHWAQKVIHPSSGITKEYIVQTLKATSRANLERMMEGVMIDGALARPLEVSTLEDNRLRFVVSEGRTHEVRLLVECAGHEVVSLKRVRIGGYRLQRALGPGQYIELTPKQAVTILDPKAQEKAL